MNDTTREIGIADVLREARKLIEKPENWCRFAQGLIGEKYIEPWNMAAEKRCALGVLNALAGEYAAEYPGTKYFAAAQCLESVIRRHRDDPAATITFFNNEHSHAEVIAAFDRAIAAAEAS